MSNDLLQKNLISFSKRFDSLHQALSTMVPSYKTPKDVSLFFARNNEQSAMHETSYMHSAYNPSGEAKKLAQSEDVTNADSVVFLGMGLGYGPIACAEHHPNKTIIIIEPDPIYALFSFSQLDWTKVFEHPSIAFLLEAPQQTVITILEQYGLRECFFIAQNAIMQHASEYFTNIQKLVARNIDKQAINMRTLERFSTLWLSNMCKNFSFIEKLDGIQRYKDKAGSLPACVLAAGPSLDSILPYLHEIKKRCILICVDTALRACLSVGVEPHFILLVDPQYWNAKHIDGLQSPSSILITESAAYPSVFRFHCKEIILCSSLFPLGKYIEKFTGKKGELSAGGSVATSAWDFARFIGCTTIFMAGLDLSFPKKRTHTRGSTFEEKSHFESTKTKTTETSLARILYNPQTERGLDYEGSETITDARMKLYAWWFESKFAANPNVSTYSLSKLSLAIPLMKIASIEQLTTQKLRQEEIDVFLETSSKRVQTEHNTIINTLLNDFADLQAILDNGIKLCNSTFSNEAEYEKAITKLNSIDVAIHSAKAKEIVSLVFPSPDQLQAVMDEKLPPPPKPAPYGTYTEAAQYNILKTKLVYELIKKSIDFHIHYLRKNS